MLTKIDKIGFEIECEASYDTQDKMQDWGNIGTDGSIRSCDFGFHESLPGNFPHDLSTIEFRSRPFPVKKMNDENGPRGLFDMLLKQHEQGEFHWNDTMGFHIHVSFNLGYRPPEIYSTEFNDYFVAELKKQFPKVYEKRKDNRYCKIDYNVEQIVRPVDRYKAINYCSWNEWQTVEFRIFGADSADRMWEELCFTVKTVQDFLEKPISKKWHIKLRNAYSKKSNVDVELKELLVTIPPVTIEGENRIVLGTVTANSKKINKYL